MSKNRQAVILVGHGGLPKDCPRETVQKFKQLERQRKAAGTAPTAEEKELERLIRQWPRTPENDPYKAGLESLADRLRPLLSDVELELAYNEFCAPSLEDAVEKLAGRGVTTLTVVPTMLTPGGSHSEVEIPEALDHLRSRYPDIEIRYAWPANLDLLAKMLADHLKTFED